MSRVKDAAKEVAVQLIVEALKPTAARLGNWLADRRKRKAQSEAKPEAKPEEGKQC
jgi:predicted HAD superfamily phosphohydrolase YqeG